jgi:NAD-dependent deacetylase sirtuin 5
VQPNAAHIALAKFSLPAFREKIAPGSTFTLITQNIDGLSTRALASVKNSLGDADIDEQAEPDILEMHGRLFDVVCTAEECGHVQGGAQGVLCLKMCFRLHWMRA